MQRQGAVLHGHPQILDEREAVSLVVECRFIDVERSALPLGSVHRDVRTMDQIGGIQSVFRGQRDANACADVQTGGADVDRLFEQRGDASSHGRGLEGIGPVEKDGELVAAQAGHQIVATDNLADTRADLAEQRVPGLVPERVVDLLEVIEVDKQEGQPASLSSAGRQRGQGPVELMEELSTISESGELIGHGLVVAGSVEGPLLAQGDGQPDAGNKKGGSSESEGNWAHTLHVAQHQDRDAGQQRDREDDDAWRSFDHRRSCVCGGAKPDGTGHPEHA